MIFVVILALIIFISYLIFIHNSPHTTNAAPAKMYIDSIVYEVEENEIKHPHKNIIPAISHFDELVQALSALSKHKEVYPSTAIYAAANHIQSLPFAQKYIVNQTYQFEEAVGYNSALGYGGCYFENEHGGFVHVIGNPESIMKMCSFVHDQDEILRVSTKWEKQGLTCIAIACADAKHGKNVLKRGVKEKMMFLGLIGIQGANT